MGQKTKKQLKKLRKRQDQLVHANNCNVDAIAKLYRKINRLEQHIGGSNYLPLLADNLN